MRTEQSRRARMMSADQPAKLAVINDALELEGVVDDGELGRLISGHHPRTSALLRSHPPKKRTTVERIDPATGEPYLEEKTLSPVAGYDLVFSPPKSVSLLHAL